MNSLERAILDSPNFRLSGSPAKQKKWKPLDLSDYRVKLDDSVYDSMWWQQPQNVRQEISQFGKKKDRNWLREYATGQRHGWHVPQRYLNNLSHGAKKYLWESNQMNTPTSGRVDPYGNRARVVQGKQYTYAPPTIVRASQPVSRMQDKWRWPSE